MNDVTTAFLFPGGGSQEQGVLNEFREEWPEIDQQLDRIDRDGLASLLFEAETETLGEIVNMHRAVVASGLIVAEAVRDRFGVEPDVVAGHSLGHITALPVAGMLSPADAVAFAERRGEAMAYAERTAGPGKMVASLLADAETVSSVTADIDGVKTGVYNAPKQLVISGRVDAVDEACERLEERDQAVKLIELDVATASHSPVMEPAVERIEQALASADLSDPSVPVVSDHSAECYETAARAEQDLRRQIVSPIRWVSVVDTLSSLGVQRVIEFPPAGSLSSFVNKIAPELEVVTLENPAAAREHLKHERSAIHN